MRAIVQHSFGSSEVLHIEHDYPEPSLADNQVLVQVKAAGINPLDWKIREGQLRMILGSRFPLILGNDAAGVVVQCGKNVSRFSVGDKVYCMVDANKKPGYFGFAQSGAYAEYVATREDTLAPLPGGLSFAEAASLPLCCLTAYQVLKHKVNLQPGATILVNGASGGVGVYAVQIAKAMGAVVTAVCSAKNEKLVRSLGADTVLDYAKVDFTQMNAEFDYVYDIVANSSYKKCRRILGTQGVFISNLASPVVFLFPFLRKTKIFRKRTFAWVEPSGEDLQVITEMVNKGLIKPVVEKIFAFEDVRTAHDASEKGKVAGKLVLSI